MKRSAYLHVAALAVFAFATLPLAAKADDCLQLGWKDKGGQWTYYTAHVDAENGERLHMNYEFHHGELELKAFAHEKADGVDEIVYRGRWFEGKNSQRQGRVRLSMKRGKHQARGWYTNGDDEASTHYDMELRECPVKR